MNQQDLFNAQLKGSLLGIIAGFALVTLACCGGEDRCDPVGSYQATLFWDPPTATNCGIDASSDGDIAFDVYEGPDHYVISVADADYTDGVIYTDEACQFVFSMGISDVEFNAIASFDITEEDGELSGGGSVSYTFVDGSSCTQGFAVVGFRR